MENLLLWLESSVTLTLDEEAAIQSYIDPIKINLIDEYNELNRKLFNGRLGIYPMKWNKSKRAGGWVKYRRVKLFGKPPSFDIIGIEISAHKAITKKIFLDTLAHEMIHVYWLEQGVDDKHQGPFKSEMRRINAMGFDVNTKRDLEAAIASGNMALKSSGKKYGVLVREFGGRTVYLATTLANLGEYAGFLMREWIMPDNVRNVLEFKVYIHSAAWLDNAKLSRKGKKSLSMTVMTLDEKTDVLENGKYITTLKKMNPSEYIEWRKNVKFE